MTIFKKLLSPILVSPHSFSFYSQYFDTFVRSRNILYFPRILNLIFSPQAAALVEAQGQDRARLRVQTEQRLSAALDACLATTSKVRAELPLSHQAAVGPFVEAVNPFEFEANGIGSNGASCRLGSGSGDKSSDNVGKIALGTAVNPSVIESTLAALDALLEDLNETCTVLDKQAITAAARAARDYSAASPGTLNNFEKDGSPSSSYVRCVHGCTVALLRLQALAERASFLGDVSRFAAFADYTIKDIRIHEVQMTDAADNARTADANTVTMFTGRSLRSDTISVESSIGVATETASIAVVEAQSKFLAALPVGALEDNDQVLNGSHARNAAEENSIEQLQNQQYIGGESRSLPAARQYWKVGISVGAAAHRNLAQLALTRLNKMATSAAADDQNDEAGGAASIDAAIGDCKGRNKSTWNTAAAAVSFHWTNMVRAHAFLHTYPFLIFVSLLPRLICVKDCFLLVTPLLLSHLFPDW